MPRVGKLHTQRCVPRGIRQLAGRGMCFRVTYIAYTGCVRVNTSLCDQRRLLPNRLQAWHRWRRAIQYFRNQLRRECASGIFFFAEGTAFRNSMLTRFVMHRCFCMVDVSCIVLLFHGMIASLSLTRSLVDSCAIPCTWFDGKRERYCVLQRRCACRCFLKCKRRPNRGGETCVRGGTFFERHT